MFEKRRKEIEARRAEIRALLEKASDEELDALERELDALDSEEATLDRKEAAANRLNRGGMPADPIPGAPNPIARSGAAGAENAGGGLPDSVDSRAAHLAELQGVRTEEAVERANQFAKNHRMQITTDAVKRSLTLSSGNIAQPTRVSGINPPPTEVSAIVDMVQVVDADGMGGDEVAYDVPDALTADVKKDDGSATEDTIQGTKIAKITPVLVSTLGYVSRRIQRTTPLNYQSRTSDAALRALRKKVGKMIVAGNPAATPDPEITGILNAAAIEATSDITISSIDAKTLRKIALAYGGDDAVEGGGVLLLNKKDLIAFGDVRGTNEKKAIYEFEFDAGSTTTGTIKEGGLIVRFCINNALPALEDADEGEYTMTYGKPLAYQLDLFGPYSVEVSRDYKFGEGLLAVMGEVMVGGNVVTHNGFLRVKKGA